MNRLNKILLSFVLPILCLLISVSDAYEFGSTQMTEGGYSGQVLNSTQVGNYSLSELKTIMQNYTDGIITFSDLEPIINSYYNNGYNVVISTSWADSVVKKTIGLFPKNVDIMSFGQGGYGLMVSSIDDNAYESYIVNLATPVDTSYVIRCNYVNYKSITAYYFYGDGIEFATCDIKKATNTSQSWYWDGNSYLYETSYGSDEPDTPPLPTNTEIAQAVQAFYNSIYNQPNIAFDDFIVLYDVKTNLYSYIGHTRGNAIGQVIVEPNGYYSGYKFDVQWWQFYLDEQNDNWDWTNITKYNNYYLYTSQGDVDTLNFVGQDKIDNLFTAGPWSTSNTIIVYSTNDYPVKYITFSDESPDPVVEEGTIKGDQYTYDENLDITDNQYNPLDNFVSVDYPSSLVSRAEFDKFMETFDENKDFLILPSDSNWIVIACNSLFNHFSSFIIMCAVFVIVERIMRG